MPALFSESYFSMKKGVWRFEISWLFLIHYKLWENQNFFFGFSQCFGVIIVPPAIKVHSKAPLSSITFFYILTVLFWKRTGQCSYFTNERMLVTMRIIVIVKKITKIRPVSILWHILLNFTHQLDVYHRLTERTSKKVSFISFSLDNVTVQVEATKYKIKTSGIILLYEKCKI